MILKRCCDQLRAAREAFVTLFKKIFSEANLFSTSDQREINDNKLSITDMSDMKSNSGTWFQNESVNESRSDSREKKNDVDKKVPEEEQSKTGKESSLEVF